MNPLSHFAKNVTSQNGEDGIIAELFSRIGLTNRRCIEFGAWDGKYLSNTWDLWHNKDWAAMLIEGDRERFLDLQKILAAFPKTVAINAFVGASSESHLDAILASSGWLDATIDLLSIDIDGDDYHVWEALTNCRPRVVVIEYNPSIPPDVAIVQKQGEYFGASAGALLELAKSKGYRLVALTATNCVFVADEDFAKLEIPEVDLLRDFDRSRLSYIVNAYDGDTFLLNHPIFSRPFPLETFDTCSERLIKNLRGQGPSHSVPAKGIVPIVVALVSQEAPRSFRDRIGRRIKIFLDISSSFLISTLSSLPPLPLLRRLGLAWSRRRANDLVIQDWRKQGSPAPPPHILKQRILAHYARRYRLKSLVETGTYHGDMLDAMRKRFRQLFSIELSIDLCQRAKERLQAYPHISILQGDSSVELPKLLSTLNTPTLFWLDGHYSAGNTARGALETPVSSEIDAILKHTVRHHVILIDDARNFDGTHDYPLLDQFRRSILAARPTAKFAVADDIIRIVL